MQCENDHGRFCEVDRGEDAAERFVQSAVHVEQSARGDARFAVGTVGPQNMSAAMGFAEDCDEKIPWARSEQPSGHLAFESHAPDEIFSDLHPFTERLIDGDFDSHRMLSEAAQDLSFELARISGEEAYLI